MDLVGINELPSHVIKPSEEEIQWASDFISKSSRDFAAFRVIMEPGSNYTSCLIPIDENGQDSMPGLLEAINKSAHALFGTGQRCLDRSERMKSFLRKLNAPSSTSFCTLIHALGSRYYSDPNSTLLHVWTDVQTGTI